MLADVGQVTGMQEAASNPPCLLRWRGCSCGWRCFRCLPPRAQHRLQTGTSLTAAPSWCCGHLCSEGIGACGFDEVAGGIVDSTSAGLSLLWVETLCCC